MIHGAGNGVFATVDFKRSDVITKYEGKYVKKEPQDAEYAITIIHKKLYLDGIRVPEKKKGLGSFVNKEIRVAGMPRKNCLLYLFGRKIYVVAIKNIKAGEELYTTYGRSYNITTYITKNKINSF